MIVYLFVMVQNSAILAYDALNFNGGSRYAALLNLLYTTTFIVLIEIAARKMVEELRYKWTKFILITIFQLINILLLVIYSSGLKFLGMPFEIGMIVPYIGSYTQIFENVEITNLALIFISAFLYILATGYFLIFHCCYMRLKLDRINIYLVVMVVINLIALPLAKSREPFIMVLFGTGFDGAPKDMNEYHEQLKITTQLENQNALKRRPLILITLDAARSDYVGFNSDAESPTPYISDIVKNNFIEKYDSAYSICPVTYCGMLGILRSTYWDHLSSQKFQLQDYLHLIGYKTYFILSGDHTYFHGLKTQFGKNIDKYYDGSMSAGYPNDDRNILEQIKSIEIDKNSFLFIHLMSTHQGGLLEEKYSKMASKIMTDENSNDDLYKMKLRYRLGINQADEHINEIFEYFKKIGILEDALIIISADHGDFLGEFGLKHHGAKNPPFEPSIKIPLIVYDKKFKYPKRQIASQIDIAPTFLYALGAVIPNVWHGIPLQLDSHRCSIESNTYIHHSFVGLMGGVKYKYIEGKQQDYAFNLDEDAMETLPITDPALLEKAGNYFRSCQY